MSFIQSISQTLQSVLGSRFALVETLSTVDGKTYRVRDLPDKQDAANRMASIRKRLMSLADALEKKYPDKDQVKRMSRNFRPDPSRFVESTPDEEHTSSTINKGDSIHLCLRQRDGPDESLVSENVLTFVALHELGHICTETIGHGQDFWNNFGWLLKEAESLGLYRYTDFAAQPVKYCGVFITDSPRYDPTKDGTDMQIGKMYRKK